MHIKIAREKIHVFLNSKFKLLVHGDYDSSKFQHGDIIAK